MFFIVLHLFMCQRKQGQSWIPKVSNAYSLGIVKRLWQYFIIGCDVIFDESKKINEKLMVSKLDYSQKHMILNQEPKMEVERILQQMQKKSNND